jgi:tryptophan halogenase
MEVKSICIVGGGSSGWMLATALHKYTDLKVTVVSSPNIGSVGVGESTVPGVSNFIKYYLGFKEEEWMPYCSAVYKASIKFNNFKYLGHTAYHPFWTEEEYSDFSAYNWAVKNELDPEGTSIEEYYYSMYGACSMSRDIKFDKPKGFSYAYHMDADKFGMFCKKYCGEGVTHILKNIEEVEVSDNGIDLLIMSDGTTISADLYVDCSGFSSLLLGKALKEPFNTTDNVIINDRAITARIPYLEGEKYKELEPYTDCTALSSGWAWNIPLWSRVGTGYVYSSQFLTEKEAKKEFRSYLSDRFGSRAQEVEFNTIYIRTGYHTRSWVKNCSSLVLASGFIEPLESSGLAIAVGQIKGLVSALKSGGYNSLDRARFNDETAKSFKEVIDFVSMHYSSTNRTDTKYWKYISEHIDIPDSLVEYLYLFNKTDPFASQHFPFKSWEALTIGFGIPNPYYNPHELTYQEKNLFFMTEEEKAAALSSVTEYVSMLRTYAERKTEAMPTHYQYLKDNIYGNDSDSR